MFFICSKFFALSLLEMLIVIEAVLVCKNIATDIQCVNQIVFQNSGKGELGYTGENRIKGDIGETGLQGTKVLKVRKGEIRGHEIIQRKNCPGVTFHFPRDNQKTDYVKYRSYFSKMTEATVCAWIVKKNITRNPTVPRIIDFRSIFSYFIKDDDELTIAITPSMQLTLKRGNRIRSLKNLSSENTKFYFCICLSSSRSSMELFINGTREEKLDYSFANISGGGSLILGNDQDVKQDEIQQEYQAFSGNITNLMVWPRCLKEEEIINIATKCECPQDYSIAMTMDKSEMYGDVSYSVADQCPTV